MLGANPTSRISCKFFGKHDGNRSYSARSGPRGKESSVVPRAWLQQLIRAKIFPCGAYGLGMTDDMLALARENQRKAGATNVEFLKGE
jgi:hypothetical protein